MVRPTTRSFVPQSPTRGPRGWRKHAFAACVQASGAKAPKSIKKGHRLRHGSRRKPSGQVPPGPFAQPWRGCKGAGLCASFQADIGFGHKADGQT